VTSDTQPEQTQPDGQEAQSTQQEPVQPLEPPAAPAAPATAQAEEQAQLAPTASQPASSEAQNQAAEMIKKGVYLSALIYVEGYQKPPDDFNTTTITALKKMLNDCLASPPDGLAMKLKSVDVQNDVEEGEDSDGGGDMQEQKDQPRAQKPKKQKVEKFQF